uniref:Uncharacterized protein n=1 Tax=Oryza brachyantha TaxID=4533 RepID=J3N2R7_ORYBR
VVDPDISPPLLAAAGSPLVSERCNLPVYPPALPISWRLGACKIIAKLEGLFSVPIIFLSSLLLTHSEER